jgi:hypothetical protein
VSYPEVMAEPVPVRKLIALLKELDAAVGADRTRRADALLQVAHDTLVHEGDRGVFEASRPYGGRKVAAQALGTTVAYVQKRASRYATSQK